jgi:hypothetical protein
MRLIAIVDAYMAFAVLHDDEAIMARIEKGRCDTFDASAHRHGSHWDYLERLEDDSRDAYFSLVSKRLGAESGGEERDNWKRIHDVAGVTIHVENSGDDPTMVCFHIQDPIADAWADAHGSLDGGTWESDGSDFAYDLTYWHPDLFAGLKKEGFDLDFSSYSEPDEHDLDVAKHASRCEQCQGNGNWEDYEKHFEATKPGAQASLFE